MLRAIEVRAPVNRNLAALQFWFDAWNSDNDRARQAYDEDMARLEAKTAAEAQRQEFPRMCNAGKHPLLSEEDTFRGCCKRCRNARDRARRRGDLVAGRERRLRKITPLQEAEVVRLYTADLLDLRRIGLKFDISHVAVRKILLRTGTPLRSMSEAARLRRKRNDD